MKLESVLKTDKFRNEFHKASLEILFTGQWLYAEYNQLLKEYNLTEQQYNVLRILRGAGNDTMNLYEVQERMINPMSNATRLVDKLRQKGLLTRELCEDNRRKVEIRITETGKQLLSEIDPKVEEKEKSLFKNISSEDAQNLSKILYAIRK